MPTRYTCPTIECCDTELNDLYQALDAMIITEGLSHATAAALEDGIEDHFKKCLQRFPKEQVAQYEANKARAAAAAAFAERAASAHEGGDKVAKSSRKRYE